MGDICSRRVPKEINCDSCMTPEDRNILKDVWAELWPDRQNIFQNFIYRLYLVEQDFKRFFSQVMTDDDGVFSVVNLNGIEGRSKTLLEGLNRQMLHIDNCKYISKTFFLFGEKYVRQNINLELIYFVWPAVRDVLIDRLGDEFTPDIERAWKHFFDFIATQMKAGLAVKLLRENQRQNSTSLKK